MQRLAFSLLELLIVILIVSLSYMLVFTSMQKSTSQPKALTPLTLKKTLLEESNSTGEREFFCLDKCTACFIYANGETIEYSNKLALENLEVYKIDSDDNSYKVDFGRFKDHKVCLRFTLYPNKSSTQMIVKHNNKFYYLPSFFDKPSQVDSLESAKALWIAPTKILKNSGEFY